MLRLPDHETRIAAHADRVQRDREIFEEGRLRGMAEMLVMLNGKEEAAAICDELKRLLENV